TVSIVGERVKDPAAVADALATHAQVPRDAAGKALAEAKRRPHQAVPVTTLPQADYDRVREALSPVPGLSFEKVVGREYHGPPSTRVLLGSVGPGTADGLKGLGLPSHTRDHAAPGHRL